MSTTDQPQPRDADSDGTDRLEETLQVALTKISELNERVDEVESDNETLSQENHRLKQRVADLEGRTDLLRLVENSDELTGKQRSITLLQHLQKAAQNSDGNADDPTSSQQASVTREQAEIALQHPDVDRTTIYTDMQRAARLVGDEDVCWYDTGGSGAQLFLDLEAGELPTEFRGGR